MKENLKKKIPVKYVLKMDLLGFVLQFFCTPAIYTYQIKLIKLGCDGFCSLTYIQNTYRHISVQKKRLTLTLLNWQQTFPAMIWRAWD